jgi:hypothetical protein
VGRYNGAMRIGTWNLDHGEGVLKNALRQQVLEEHGADIWVLTETSDELRPTEAHSASASEERPLGEPPQRWVTIWSRYKRLGRVKTVDGSRTVASRFATPERGAGGPGGEGEVIVFGTVLPWHSDCDAGDKNWDKFHRVVPAQGQEWVAVREQFPHATLVVAGDFNQSLAGSFYWTRQCRTELRAALDSAGLQCPTGTWPYAHGTLEQPPIDHVAVAPPLDARLEVNLVTGWHGRNHDDVELTDHSGVLVDFETVPIEGWLAR